MSAAPITGPARARAAARRRHPSMGTPVGCADLHGPVAAAIARVGGTHPEVAASVLAVRGRSGLDADAFARRAGVDPDVLHAAEAGHLHRDQLPGALRRMVPQADRAGPGQKFSSL